MSIVMLEDKRIKRAVIDWIASGLEEEGKTNTGLAKAMGLAQSRIVEILKGDRNVKIEELPKIARYLGKPIPLDLMYEDEHIPSETIANELGPPEGVPYAGIAEAGTWRRVDLYNQLNNSAQRMLPLIRDPRFLHCPQFAYEIRGDSMNKANIYDGMWALSVSYEDYARSQGDLRTGMIVVVARYRFDNQEIELTVKEAKVFRDRIELHPRSTNETHEPIIVTKDFTSDTGEKVEVIAVVLQATFVFGF